MVSSTTIPIVMTATPDSTKSTSPTRIPHTPKAMATGSRLGIRLINPNFSERSAIMRIMEISTRAVPVMVQMRTRYLFTTNSPSRFIARVVFAETASGKGNIAMRAGRKVMDKTKAMMTPIATILPKSRKGGAPLKFTPKKQIAVVKLVREMG